MRFEIRPESIFFIGIAGGSCAGKSTFARRLCQAFGEDFCQILSLDSYYRDQSQQFDHDGGAINFDNPASIDFELLRQHLLQLQSGIPINIPTYDFTTHQRLSATVKMYPTDVIIVEGELILSQPAIVELLSDSVFIETSESLRLERRINRDLTERGRSLDGVLAQFRQHVRPMHEIYVQPYKSLATHCITDEGSAQQVIDELIDKLGIDS